MITCAYRCHHVCPSYDFGRRNLTWALSSDDDSEADLERGVVIEQINAMLSESDGEASDIVVVKSEAGATTPLRKISSRRLSLRK
jgi:hypothetical protein